MAKSTSAIADVGARGLAVIKILEVGRTRVCARETSAATGGAATSVWAGFVADADTVGGRYCEDCRVAEVNDNAADAFGVRSYALDPERAQALWIKSKEMVEERF